MTLAELINSLTLDQAIQWDRETDKLIWIETNLLDPAGLSRRLAEKVEAELDRIYCDWWNETTAQETTDRMYSN